MPRSCTICSHPQHSAIDSAIQAGTAHTTIAHDYQVTRDCVRRHAQSHLVSTAQPKRPSSSSPVTHAQLKRPQGQNIPDNLREQIQQDFLDAFVLHGVVTRACQEVGIHRSILRQWVEHDAEFAMAYEMAKEKVNDLYRDEARRRAVEGVETYVISQGKIVYVLNEKEELVPLTERKYSDTMLQFIMKARMPEYRDKQQVEISGKDGGPIQTQQDLTVDVRALSTEQLIALQAVLHGSGDTK